MRPYLLEYYGNPSQPYGFAKEPQKALKSARERIARCINADPEEIFFTSCGTESDNWVIKGVAYNRGKDYVTITSEISLGKYNTVEEAAIIGEEIIKIVKG